MRHTNPGGGSGGPALAPPFRTSRVGSRDPTNPDAWPHAILGAIDDDRPPICPVCGVTMVPVALSARGVRGVEWICLECEETGDPDER